MALIHVNFFSDVLGMSTQMEVILPQPSDQQIGIAHASGRIRYPVLYLLHGMTDNHTTWTRNTSIERYAAEHGIAVIMPNAHLSWYTNMHMGFNYFDHIAEEIPAICAQYFPMLSTERRDTFIAGNSMGGYGALLHGLSRPDRFAGIAALSAATDVCEVMRQNPSFIRPTFWSDIFGDTSALAGSEHDLFALSQRLSASTAPKPKIYMWCGTGDFLHAQNVCMSEHLRALRWDYEYHETEGDHSWKCWDPVIADILNWIEAVRQGGAC